MTTRAERIRDEAVLYGQQMATMDFAPANRASAMYSFGIEMGMAIAIAAGAEAPALLAEFRDGVYPHDVDREITDKIDGTAAEIVAP